MNPTHVTFQHEQDRERSDRYTGERFRPTETMMKLPRITGWEDVNMAALARAMRRPYPVLRSIVSGKDNFVKWSDLRLMAELLEMPLATVVERIDYSQRLNLLDAYRVNLRPAVMEELIEKARFADWEAIKKLITPEAAALVVEDIREGRITE